VLVGGLSPALRSFLDRLPTGQKSASTPALPSPALHSLRSGDRRIWPVPPTEVALRPGLALLAEVQRLHGSEAIVWIGQEGGLFSVEGPFSRGLRRDWSQALRRLERQLQEEHDDPVRQAQALNLCWSWGTDCNPQLLSGFSSPQWAGHLSRALRRQEWPVAPTLDDPPPPPQTAANPAVPAVGPGEQIYVQPEQSGRTVVELSLLCGWDCRTLPTSYLENLWELRSAALRRRLGGSRVELGCDPQRCRVWVDSLAEELAPTLLTVYDWLQNTPVGVDVEGPDAQEAAIAAVVGRPVEGGGFISPRRGAAELARLREAPVVVVAVGATQGLEEGLRPWRSPRTDGEYKKPSMPPLFVTETGEEAADGRVSLLWAAPSPAAPERSAWEVAFLSITGSPASALERRLREELGWVYGFALSEEIGPHGSYMRLDLDVPVERQSALRSEVEAILARSRPAGWERALWEARQSDPEFATRAAAMSRRALWGLSPGAPALPSPAEVERAFSSLPSPMWVIGGQLSPSGVGRAWPARSSPTGDPA
ncbi:MAG TPA: hypothetical protein PKW90_08825, partial [Myxococcota bacterium]|nr:hypothetical protein [Myxococcota bacterium]